LRGFFFGGPNFLGFAFPFLPPFLAFLAFLPAVARD
jgi:hypothetical protein